jgi:raw score 2.35
MKAKPVRPTTKPVSMMKQQRKIIQITTSNAMSESGKIETLIALCNDGTLWQRSVEIDDVRVYGGDWFQIENVPQN